jgi:hypothetical protein
MNSKERKNDDALLEIDFSPINLSSISNRVARDVNAFYGAKDGGNINLAMGRVLYPEDAEARIKKILSSNII